MGRVGEVVIVGVLGSVQVLRLAFYTCAGTA